MKYPERVCQREGCNEKFSPRTFNQKFHDKECRRINANERLMVKYYVDIEIRSGKTRPCIKCGTKLSRYNNKDKCNSCQIQEKNEIDRSVAALLSGVNFQ